jgi:apolipoprotein N-acyltransferase
MKGITFAIAFILTAFIVVGGVALYPNILGQAAAYHNDFVFGFFLGPFFVLLFFAWIGEKIVLKIRKRKE